MIRVFSQYISPKSFLRVLFECGLIVFAMLCAARLRFWDSPSEFDTCTRMPEFAFQSLLFVVTIQICFYYGDLYRPTPFRRRVWQLVSLGQALGAACIFLGLLYYLLPDFLIGRGVFFISIGLVAVFVMPSRLVLDSVWQAVTPHKNVLILGTGPIARAVARELIRRGDLSLRLIGFVEPGSLDRNSSGVVLGLPILGTAEHLASFVHYQRVSRIVVALEERRGALPIRELLRLKTRGVLVEDAQTLISSLSGRVWLQTVRPSWFVFSEGFRRPRITLVLKRLLDILFGFIGLVISAPLMALIAAAIRLDSHGPVIFRQPRVGLKAKHFELLKFRSMREDAERENGAQWAEKERPPRHSRRQVLENVPPR